MSEDLVQGVPLGSLGEPHPVDGKLVEIRFMNEDGATEVWMVPKGAVDFGRIQGMDQVKLAFLDLGVDTRLSLLQEHVESHHDELSALYRREFGTGYDCRQFAGGTNAPPKD